jgi:type IV pilus assembly protein PilA
MAEDTAAPARPPCPPSREVIVSRRPLPLAVPRGLEETMPSTSAPRPSGHRLSARPAAPARRGLAITSLVLGLLSLFTFGLAGIGALVGLALGIVAVVKESRQPRLYGGRGAAIAGIVLNALGLLALPLAAAIAIPSLLRARITANEAAAVDDIRTVVSAQVAYSASNAGYFDGRLECLAAPAPCIPGYGGPTFLDGAFASPLPRHGYRGRLIAGPAAQPPADRAGKVSPSSVKAFAYLVVPVRAGQTGVRAFCADASGVVCYTPDGGTPRTTSTGGCDLSGCRSMQ